MSPKCQNPAWEYENLYYRTQPVLYFLSTLLVGGKVRISTDAFTRQECTSVLKDWEMQSLYNRFSMINLVSPRTITKGGMPPLILRLITN